MFWKWFAVVLVLTPSVSPAALLHYELEFETYDAEHWVGGSGYFVADTDLEAIVAARLESDEFVFSWDGPVPAPLSRVGDYYGADVVFAGNLSGLDLMTGETATLNLSFLLVSASGDGTFADELDRHFPEDIYSVLDLPDGDRPSGHWLNAPLTTHFTLSSPVMVAVSEPPALALLAVGGLLVSLRKRRCR